MTRDAASEYANSAVEQGAATDRGDHEKANAAHDRLMWALASLRESPDRGRSVLQAFLHHKDPHLRCWAATHLLPLDEAAATHVLKSQVSEPPFVGFNAEMVLREWRAGRLRVP